MNPDGSPPPSFEPPADFSQPAYPRASFSRDIQAEQAALESAAAPVRSRSSRFRRMAQAPATYVLLGVNVAVYLWMIFHGVDRWTPTPDDLIRFGANNAQAVIGAGQWW